MTSRALAISIPFLLAACGSSAVTPNHDGEGTAGTMGGGGATAGSDGAAGAGGHDAGDGSVADAGDAPAGPAPVLVARAPGCGQARLALAGGKVYWTERATGAVKRLDLADPGGTPAVVAMNQPAPGPIAADDANVYWANAGDKTIMKAPLAGGAASVVVTAPAVVGGLVARTGTLFYGAGPSAFTIAATVVGATPTTIMTFPVCRPTDIGAVALDADHLYQTDHNNQYLTREKIDGTQLINDQCAADPPNAPQVMAPDVISHSQGSLLFDALAVANGEIVWADSSNISAKNGAADRTTGSRSAARTLGGNPITGFVVAGTKLYFGESNEPPTQPGGDDIEVAPLDPGEAGVDDPKVVAHGQRNASSFVADVGHVYWVTHTPAATGGSDAAAPDDCAIMSLATAAGAAP